MLTCQQGSITPPPPPSHIRQAPRLPPLPAKTGQGATSYITRCFISYIADNNRGQGLEGLVKHWLPWAESVLCIRITVPLVVVCRIDQLPVNVLLIRLLAPVE